MSENVRITTELKAPSELGKHYRLVCMTGPNKGKVYYLLTKRILIGRGETADIQIIDTKISREHAELAFADNSYVITDLGTANGIIVSDNRVKQKKLIDNEKIVIGQTVFKFNILEITKTAEMVLAEEFPETPTAKEIKKGVKVKIQTKNQPMSEFEEIKPIEEDKKNKPQKTILILVIVVVVGYVLFGGGGEENQTKAKKAENNPNMLDDGGERLAAKGGQDDADVKKKLAALIHSGRREFREGNYFRAMEEFRLAMLLSPTNGQASYYLSKAKQRLDEEIQNNFDKGNQEYDSKKYQASIISYCGVVQLIKEYPDDERYKNAMSKISAIESELGMEKGEIKCFEEKSADSRN